MARSFARGSSPPPGSIEYAAIGGPLFYNTQSGFQLYEISYTELDAAKRWIDAVDRSVSQARKVHGDRVLSDADARAWERFMTTWRPFYGDMSLPGHFNTMLKTNRKSFDDLLAESRRLYEGFARKGMSKVPVPYADELLVVLRTTPKKLTAAEMQSRLLAGARCGEKMIDQNTAWHSWLTSTDHRPLQTAIKEARLASDIYGRSRRSSATYVPGDPAYDDFLRALTKIWIEAASLAGIRETHDTTFAELTDDIRDVPEKTSSYLLWLLAAAGVSYLGYTWLSRPRAPTVVVAVPDAYPPQES